MELLYWFETIRTPALDAAMSLVTRLGEETFFMVAALFVFWCVDKRRGYYLLAVGFTGTLINQWLKIVCRVPRPWVRDPHFTIVARMYLGVHTPADVGVSFAVTAVLVLLLYPLIESTLWFPGRMYVILGVLLGVSGAFVAFVELFPFPADVDGANLAGAVKNAWSMAGAVGGMLLACLFDNRLLQFPNRAPWWGQLVKLLGGLVLVVLVKSLLKAPLLALCGGHQAAHALRYFLMVLTAGALWPMTFRFFERYAR